MEYKDEYIDYMIDKISTLGLKHFDIVKESLDKIREDFSDTSFSKKIQPIHSHYYRNHHLDFLDYWNYKRCRDLDIPVK
jgi:hypothetical protein